MSNTIVCHVLNVTEEQARHPDFPERLPLNALLQMECPCGWKDRPRLNIFIVIWPGLATRAMIRHFKKEHLSHGWDRDEETNPQIEG